MMERLLAKMDIIQAKMDAIQVKMDANLKEMKAEIRANNEPIMRSLRAFKVLSSPGWTHTMPRQKLTTRS
jgi:hypothetical protein